MKSFVALLAAVTTATALKIGKINGNRFLSPYDGQNVTNVKGLVTAVGSNGFYLRSTRPDCDKRSSEGLFVYGYDHEVAEGDIVRLGGTVHEYR